MLMLWVVHACFGSGPNSSRLTRVPVGFSRLISRSVSADSDMFLVDIGLSRDGHNNFFVVWNARSCKILLRVKRKHFNRGESWYSVFLTVVVFAKALLKSSATSHSGHPSVISDCSVEVILACTRVRFKRHQRKSNLTAEAAMLSKKRTGNDANEVFPTGIVHFQTEPWLICLSDIVETGSFSVARAYVWKWWSQFQKKFYHCSIHSESCSHRNIPMQLNWYFRTGVEHFIYIWNYHHLYINF